MKCLTWDQQNSIYSVSKILSLTHSIFHCHCILSILLELRTENYPIFFFITLPQMALKVEYGLLE